MRIHWHDLSTPRAREADGQTVTMHGYQIVTGGTVTLVPEPPCCAGCLPTQRGTRVTIIPAAPVRPNPDSVRWSGRWRVTGEPAASYELHGATPLDPPGWRAVTRRRALIGGPLMCLAACASAAEPGQAREVIAAATAIDLHSHAGGMAGLARIRSGVGFAPIAAPMREGGMTAISLAMVADSPAIKIEPDGRIKRYREPEPGELYAHAKLAMSRLRDWVRSEGLNTITTAEDLRGAKQTIPSVIVAAEGADFLEGQIGRLDEAHGQWNLRHLQLTHYRVNELGDIQTEPPVHGGLTDFGAAVIRRCNELGIAVDVAHGTLDLVKRAAAVTRKPLVLSHTSLRANPAPFSRRISAAHAKVIADTDGVIGVWPPAGKFPTLAAMAAGIARMVDAAGIDHVGLGSDLRGLTGASIFPDYHVLPDLTEALLDAGFTAGDTAKLLGGNARRVYLANLP